MKFVFPIENMGAKSLYARNQAGRGGFYPIGRNKMYHGGIHIEGDYNVVAITDGTLIAYRYKKKYCEDERKGKKYRYSNCFVLIRHEYKTPNGQPIVFFSHYNHLCPWEEFNEEQNKRLPAPFSKPGFKITSAGLRARSAPDTIKKNVLSTVTLSKGDEVVASPIDNFWAKKDGEEVYFAYSGFADPITIQSDQLQLDAIATCEIPIKAGDLLGYTGCYEDKRIPENHKIVHIEVFAGDDTVDLVNNKKKDGEKNSIVFQVASGATLKKLEKKYPDITKLTKYSLAANTHVEVTETDAEKKWCNVKEIALVNILKRNWFDRHTDVPSDIHYTPKADNLADVRKGLGSSDITATSKLYLLKELKDKDRLVKYALPPGTGRTCWVKAAAVAKGGTTYYLKAATDGYSENPDVVVFTKDAVTLKAELNEKIKNTESTKDENGKMWHKVGSGANEGWIAEDDGKLKKLSAFDWPKFKIAKETGSTAGDPFIDFKKLTPFFKTIINEINTDKDQEISDSELKVAILTPELATKLSHLICYHQSEWYLDDGLTGWEKVFKLVGVNIAKKVGNRLKELCWWQVVAGKSKLFLKSPDVYHWHPITFVEQMNTLSSIIALDDKERSRIMSIISKFEGQYYSCNKDTEFSMSKNQVSYAGIVHIGLSWGFIQFTQDSGNLGKVLKLMSEKNKTEFSEVFGDNWKELLKIATASGKSGQELFQSNGGKKKADKLREDKKEFFGSRVKKIAIKKGGPEKHLWEKPWVDRFEKAGKIEVFQRAQDEVAISDFLEPALSICKDFNIQTAKGVVITFDRCVNQGVGGCRKLYTNLFGNVKFIDAENELKSLVKIRDHWSSKHFIHIRINKILIENKLEDILYDTDTY